MAAKRNGIRTVIIPKENQRDLMEIDPVVRDTLQFVTVDSIDAVLPVALCPMEPAEEPRGEQQENFIAAIVPVEKAVKDSPLRQ